MDVYSSLAQHQVSEAWFGRALMETLQTWAGRFVVDFELDIPEMVLCVEQLPVSRLGHFRRGHKCSGLKGEIALMRRAGNGQVGDVCRPASDGASPIPSTPFGEPRT